MMSMNEVEPDELFQRLPYTGFASFFIEYGRILSAIFVFSLFFVTMRRFFQIISLSTPSIPLAIFAVQFFICFKLILYGEITYAVMSIFILFVQIFFLLKISILKSQSGDILFAIRSIALCGSLSSLFCLYLLIAQPDSALVAGRFRGYTPNPQNMMMVLSLAMPSTLYLFQTNSNYGWKILHAAQGALLTFLVYETGSRSGALVILLSLAICFWSSPIFWIGTLLIAATSILFQMSSEAGMNMFSDFFFERGDNRTYIWARQWQEFLSSPVWGMPPIDGKFLYSENAWLSLLNNGGIIAGIPLAIAVYLVAKRCYAIITFRKWSLYRSFLLSTTLSVLLLSLAESVFAATYSTYALMSFIYLAMPLENRFER